MARPLRSAPLAGVMRAARAETVSTIRRKTSTRADAPLTFWVAALSGIVLLVAAPEARAAVTSQAVGTAVLLQASSLSASMVIARTGTLRGPRGNLGVDHDAIARRGLVSSPMALPPLHPRATRRHEMTTVESLSEARRPHVAVEVERPRVHVRRRETPVIAPVARRTDDDVRKVTLRDAWTTVSSRRGPPVSTGRRTA